MGVRVRAIAVQHTHSSDSTHLGVSEQLLARMAGKAGKPVAAMIRLQVKAGKASPSPPVGPALGQHGLNIMEFCKDFNAKTANVRADVVLPVKIQAFKDRTFTWSMSSPPTSNLLK